MRLVFLNGWGASSAMLEYFKQHLPASYEFYILDEMYKLELSEIAAEIEALMTENTVLIGWSLGGMLAMHYASLNMSIYKPKALILLNSSVCFIEKRDLPEGVKHEDFDGLKQGVKHKDAKSLLRLFSHLLVEGSLSYKEDRRLLKRVFDANTLPCWKALSKGLSYLEDLDLRKLQRPILQPTLFVLGEKDVLVRHSSNSNLVERNMNFKVNNISGMGHFPFGYFAKNVADVVVSFISSLDMTSNKRKC